MKNILLIILFTATSFAQVTQEWVSTFSGSDVQWGQFVNSIAVDGSGNAYVIAVRDSGINNDKDYTILKYNSEGIEQWDEHYDGTGNGEDIPHSIAVDESGNVYVTGHSKGTETLLDYATIKYDTDGLLQWVKLYNGTGNGNDRAKSIAVDELGNVYVTGESDGAGTSIDYVTIKYSTDGTEEWVKRFNGASNGNDLGYRIAVDISGNVYATGSSSSGSGQDYDFATVKYNSNGDQQWVKIYDGPASGEDNPFAITVDDAGNVYLAGESEGVGTYSDFTTIKYNTNGDFQWEYFYNGSGNSSDVANSIALDNEGNVFVTGSTWGISNADYTTIKFNTDGDPQWIKNYSRTGDSDDFAKSIAVDGTGNVYVTGESWDSGNEHDYATIKYNSTGDEKWIQTYNSPVGLSDLAKSVAIDNAGNVYVAGYTVINENDYDYTTIKYSSARKPVLIVPGIAGTYSSSILFDLNWILNRGLTPDKYQIDPLGKVYHDIIKTFENIGYKKDTTLFVVNYDWRLTPGPIDNNIDGKIDGLTGVSISDNQFTYGVDYLGWYIKQASERWRELYDEDLDSIDVIAHSTGGLVTRSYIQSDAYGDVYNISENYKLPKIRNFVMIGVPNRGASKAWNPIHDNWIADPIYAFVLSKILNRAYQKLRLGFTIYGPDYNITYLSILNQGVPDLNLFIDLYVPTIRYLLATYNFLDLGNGFNNVNEDPDIRNTIVLDLNNGYDLMPNSSPNDFLDSTKATVIYGTGESTKVLVQKRNDFQLFAVQSFTDWAPMPVLSGTDWYEDLETTNNGDGTVPIISAANQFSGDSRANLIPYSSGDHTGLVSKVEVQKDILNLFNQKFTDDEISTGSSESVINVLCVISDPVELFVTDGAGRRLGYSNSTGAVTEIPNSLWTGDTDGMGYVFGSVQEPINLQLTGLGEDYYVMVSIQDSGRYGGVVLEGFLALGEVINYQITLDPLSVDQINSLTPESFELAQNYPNPFNPVTTIQYSIPQRSNVTLKVYDLLGKEIALLVNEEKDRGVYSVNFDASGLSSGVYFYRLQTGSFAETKKMILLR